MTGHPLRSLLQRSTDLLFSADPMLRVRSSMAMLAVLLMASSAGVMLWLAYAGYGALRLECHVARPLPDFSANFVGHHLQRGSLCTGP